MTPEQNERFTRVGPGTPTGAVMRRHWWPLWFSDGVVGKPVPVRILGEDLVLFRDGQGQVGLTRTVPENTAPVTTSAAPGTLKARSTASRKRAVALRESAPGEKAPPEAQMRVSVSPLTPIEVEFKIGRPARNLCHRIDSAFGNGARPRLV